MRERTRPRERGSVMSSRRLLGRALGSIQRARCQWHSRRRRRQGMSKGAKGFVCDMTLSICQSEVGSRCWHAELVAIGKPVTSSVGGQGVGREHAAFAVGCGRLQGLDCRDARIDKGRRNPYQWVTSLPYFSQWTNIASNNSVLRVDTTLASIHGAIPNLSSNHLNCRTNSWLSDAQTLCKYPFIPTPEDGYPAATSSSFNASSPKCA